MSDPGDATATALDGLRSNGVRGEVYFETGRRTEVAVSGGKVENLQSRQDRGIGIRVFDDGRVGFAFTADLSPEGVVRAVRHAKVIAAHALRDEAWRLPEARPVDPLPFPNEDPSIEGLDPAARVEFTLALDRAARETDPRVRSVREAALIDYRGQVRVAHTEGLDASYRFSRAIARIEVAAGEGDRSQVGHHAAFSLGPRGLDAGAVGREAATRAIDKLGAEPGKTGRVRAVLHRDVVSGLLDALAPAFSSRRVLRGTTFLAGRIGDRVASSAVCLVDDPLLPGGAGSAPLDGEGLPTHRTALIEGGVLAGFLHESFTTVKLGYGRPGNTVRASYLSPPQIGPMNLVMLPGDAAPDDLVERARDGLLIREVMGLHTIDAVSGDFSLGGSGRTIEGGRLTVPVERLAFSGNVLELLAGIECVGSDLELFPGGGGCPSVLIGDLSVAGS